MRSWLAWFAVVAFALVALSRGPMLEGEAWGAAATSDKARAKTEHTRGRELMSKKEYERAVAPLRAAVDLDPRAQYQLDLARALAETGALVEAIELCVAVEHTPEKNTAKAKAAAGALRKKLEPRIPWIKVDVAGVDPSRATATIDGQPIEVGVETAIDPGQHNVQVIAADRTPAQQSVEIAEGEHKSVTLTVARIVTKEEPKPSKGNMIPAAVAYGVSGAILIAGGVMGFLAFDQTAKTEEACGGKVCPPELAGEIDLAKDYGTASTVLFSVGALGTVAAIILTFTVGLDASAGTESSAGVHVTPYVGFGQAGVVGTF